MTERARILIEQAKLLSAEEREQILDALLASVHGDRGLGDGLESEVERRLAAIDAGEEPTEDLETALAELGRK